MKGRSGEKSLASTAHMGHEFEEEEEAIKARSLIA